jgi:hypothetical protein
MASAAAIWMIGAAGRGTGAYQNSRDLPAGFASAQRLRVVPRHTDYIISHYFRGPLTLALPDIGMS